MVATEIGDTASGRDDVDSIARRLAERVRNVTPDTLEPEVLEAAAERVLDTVSVAIGAAALRTGTAAAALVASGERRPGEATVWGYGVKGPMADVALANGMLAHALDFDDTHIGAVMHCGAVVIPTALAAAEVTQATGRELLAAIVAGYEVGARLGELAPGDFQRHGFQATSVLGVFASAAAAGHLLGMDTKQLANAMGLAGSMAGGILEFLADGSETKQLHAGWAAHAGIYAVRLSAAGATGPFTVLEGRHGVFESYIGQDVDVGDLDHVRDDTPYAVLDTATKPYASCHATHACIEAAIDLRQTTDLCTDSIERITCIVPEWYVNAVLEPLAARRSPRTAYEAKFSLPYCVAKALRAGAMGPESFTKDAIEDHATRLLASRVVYEVSDFPTYPESLPAELRIEVADGPTLTRRVERNAGGAGKRATTEDIRRKAFQLLAGIPKQESAHALVTSIAQLPDSGSLTGLIRCLDQAVVPNAWPTVET